MLYGKTVLIGVCGGIAAYKACDIISRLRKFGASVEVIMTQNATEFVAPLTYESLSGNEVITDMFLRKKEWEIEHISLAKKADLMVIVPATANIVGKLANGICDDMLTTTFMACKAPKIICPAMNTAMYNDSQFNNNLNTLRKRNITIIKAQSGRLACGDIGAGKLADIDTIYDTIVNILMPVSDYNNKIVMVTAGATKENIDNVRFISNYSSGKMGVAIAKAAIDRGAKVILIAGHVSVDFPKGLYKIIRAISTDDMYKAVMDNIKDVDIIIKAAAPADYTIAPYKNKLKAKELTLRLIKTTDIAKEVGKVKGHRKLVIFSAETENLIANAKSKLISKNADMVIANDITQEGAGFNQDTNIVTIITNNGIEKSYDKMLKSEVANIILDYTIKL